MVYFNKTNPGMDPTYPRATQVVRADYYYTDNSDKVIYSQEERAGNL